MNGDTNNPFLPTLTADLLTRSGLNTDNLFSTMWKRLRFDTLRVFSNNVPAVMDV